MADAERDLKHLTEMESKKSRDHRKRRRGHKDRDRSRSCEDSEELRNFRDAINRLESNIDLTVPPPPPLTECLTDSPAQLLSSAWSVVGLADVIQLTPARLLTSCRRQQSRQLGRFRAKTPTEVDLPTGFFSAAEGQEEVRVLWRRCLKELEKMEADEVVAVLEKERDPLTVTWKPNQRDNRLVHVEVQTDAIGNNDSDDYDDATEEPKKSRDGAKVVLL